MNTKLTLRSEQMDQEQLHDLAVELGRTITSDAEVRVEAAESPGGAGTRGDLVTVGTLVLAFLTSGSVAAICRVLRAYFERQPSLKVTFKTEKGELTIDARDIAPEQLDSTLQELQQIVADSP